MYLYSAIEEGIFIVRDKRRLSGARCTNNRLGSKNSFAGMNMKNVVFFIDLRYNGISQNRKIISLLIFAKIV